MKERPILFTADMVRAILDDRKTQTRRIVKPQLPANLYATKIRYEEHPFSPSAFAGTPAEGRVPGADRMAWVAYDWVDNPVGVEESDFLKCPYGQVGDLLWYNRSEGEDYDGNENDERGASDANTGVAEQRLHGGGGRADLLPHEVQGIRTEGTDRLVPAGRAQGAQGLFVGQHEPREREGHKVNSQTRMHGISRNAGFRAADGSPTHGRESGEQQARESRMGDSGGELARQAGAWDGDGGREAPCGETDGRRATPCGVGDSPGAVQPASGGEGPRDVSVCNRRNRGSILWVRESWAAAREYDHLPPSKIPASGQGRLWYAADGIPKPEWVGKLRPSMFMPRWACRLTLRITEIRVERVQVISRADAIAEGIQNLGGDTERWGTPGGCYAQHPCRAYWLLWDSINGKKPGCSWEANPWVWVIGFERVEEK